VDLIAKQDAFCSGKEQKEPDTQKQNDDALQRERANRQRVGEIQASELKHAIVTTERKNDKAWEKVCGQMQAQLRVLQTQVAQYEIQRVRQEKYWDATEQKLKGKVSLLQDELHVKGTLLISCTIFSL
jgi:hypothetical protein